MRRAGRISNWRVFRSSVMAGIFIGMASLGFVMTGGGWLGILLFACGLIGCVWYELLLYTGWCGFARWREFDFIHWILLGNIIGTLLVAGVASSSLPSAQDLTAGVVQARLNKTWGEALLLGIPCGLLMSFAVNPLKPWIKEEKRTWLPLLFAVPLFLICGFLHSIADSFYYWMMGWEWLGDNWWPVLRTWGCVVVGNFIGCNVYRWLIPY